MSDFRLGKSGITVNRLAFGALPLQRMSTPEAVAVLLRAVEGGVTFFDTARLYTDSEAKLGLAFEGMRERVVIASKSMGKNGAEVKEDLAASLAALRTDYLDLYQVHHAKIIPRPGDGTGVYDTMAELKQQGIIRAIGLSAHSLSVALEAAGSGLYDTVQYPFSLLAAPEEVALTRLCREADVGFLAMKALAGGLITDIPAAYAYIHSHDNVLPLWGIQAMEELEQFLALAAAPPAWDAAMRERADVERAALAGQFCRGCGYCLPCPQGIAIPYVARMKRLLRRSPWQQYSLPEWVEKMATARTCLECGECSARCPYDLDTPALLAENVEDYERFMLSNGVVPW